MATTHFFRLVTAPLLAVSLLCLSLPVGAVQRVWTVCNRTPESVRVAIAYGEPGGYASEGWWRLGACGGCAVVLSRDVPVTGAFLRGESSSGAQFAGDTLMCTADASPFQIHAADKKNQCVGRGRHFETFGWHVLNKTRHTTNLRGGAPGGRVCID